MTTLKRQFPMFVIALVLGAGLGFFVGLMLADGKGQTNRPTRETSIASTLREAATPVNHTPDQSTPRIPSQIQAPNTPEVTRQSDDQAPTTLALTGTLRDRLEAALSDLPPVEVETGTGVITGVVTDKETGAPIPDVLVEAQGARRSTPSTQSPRRPETGDPATEADPVSLALRAIEVSRAERGIYFHTRTNADGTYILERLPDTAFRMTLRAPDFVFSYDPAPGGRFNQDQSAMPGDSLNFVGVRRWAVTIEVLMPDGGPASSIGLDLAEIPAGVSLESARLGLGGHRFREVMGWAGPGDFRYHHAGLYAYRASPRPDNGSVVSEDVVVEVGEGKPNHVRLQLRSVPGLLVRLVDDPVRPRVAAHLRRIQAMPWGGDTPPTMHDLQNYRTSTNDAKGYVPTRLASDGRSVLLPGLNLGRHAVVVVDDTTIAACAYVEVIGGTQELTITMPPPPRESYIVVWVRDQTGNLLKERATIELTAHARSRSDAQSESRTTWAPDGSFRVPHYKSQHLPHADQWTLRVSHPKYGSKLVPIVPGPENEVTIQFAEPAVLVLEVSGMASHPVGPFLLAQMTVVPSEGMPLDRDQSFGSENTTTGFVFGEQQPGPVDVEFSISYGARFSRLVLSRFRMELVPGKNIKHLTLPPLFELTVSVPKSSPGVYVLVSPELETQGPDGRMTSRFVGGCFVATNDKRVAEIKYLPAGRYQVTCDDRSGVTYGADYINIPGTPSLTLTSE